MPESDAPKLPQRPRRPVEGALVGGLAGFLVGALASRDTDDTWTAAGIGAASSLALGALAPVPLSQALDQAATALGLALVSVDRTGPRGVAALVEARDGYHTIKYETPNNGTRDAIDDELYGQLVARMRGFSCPT